jgi:hypothetical protein
MGYVRAGNASSGEEIPPLERRIFKRLETLLQPALLAADIEAYAAEGAQWRVHDAVRFVQGELIAPGNSNT